MAARTIAIGDIHGCHRAFARLLEILEPETTDTIVTLGDYVDRGPESRLVIERLIELAGSCRLIPLLGNHDIVFMQALSGSKENYSSWLQIGGDATLRSYNGGLPPLPRDLELVPESHFRFLESCRDSYETATHFFVHASYDPDRELTDQPETILRWSSLRDFVPAPHRSGKTAVTGHTSQKRGEILDLGHIICIDTYCYGGGWLTAFDPVSRAVWQARESGLERTFVLTPEGSDPPGTGPS